MIKTLERAIAEATTLPAAEQDKLGRDILAYLAKLRGLREIVDGSIERGGSHTDEDVEAYIENLHTEAEAVLANLR